MASRDFPVAAFVTRISGFGYGCSGRVQCCKDLAEVPIPHLQRGNSIEKAGLDLGVIVGFRAEEEESPVTAVIQLRQPYRAADGSAEVVLLIRRPDQMPFAVVGEWLSGIKCFVGQVLVG